MDRPQEPQDGGLSFGGLSQATIIALTCGASLFGGFVVVVVGAATAALPGHRFASAMIGLLAAFASAAVGGLLGFVFGVPRDGAEPTAERPTPVVAAPTADVAPPAVSANPGETPSAPTRDAVPRSTPPTSRDSPRLFANNSLQQVSEWLPKVIVGAGLVGIKDFADWIAAVGRQIGLASGGTDENAGVVGASILLYFSVVGFMSVYIHTRTIVAIMFARSIDALTDRAVENAEHVVTNLSQRIEEVAERTARGARARLRRENEMHNLLNQPGRFPEVIEIGDVERRANTLSAWGYLLLACAHGQDHASLLAKSPEAREEIAAARARALEALREAIRRDPSQKLTARQLLTDPTSADDDLRSLQADEEFLKVIT